MDGLYPWMNNSQNINDGFRDQMMATQLNGIQNGITSGFGDVNNAICSGINGLSQQMYSNQIADLERSFAAQTANTSGLTGLQAQLSQCCCDNRAATADLKYAISSEFCGLGNTIQSGLRDVIDNQNANYRGIMDFLVQEKLSSKDARIAELTNQLSQSNQNAVIGARIDAAVAELLRRTGNDCPTAAYLVQPPTPVNFPVNGCGQVQFGGYGYGGCGC